jgi:hypothetical protein
VQVEVNSPTESVEGQEPLGEVHCSFGILPLAGDAGSEGGLEQQRWFWDRGAQASKAAPEPTTEVEHTEVKSSRCLDEDASGR